MHFFYFFLLEQIFIPLRKKISRMETVNENLRDEFLRKELEAYMQAHSIKEYSFFFSKTPEEMMELPEMEIQLISYIESLKNRH